MEGILALVGLSSLLGIIMGFKAPFPKLKNKKSNSSFADNILVVEDNKNNKEPNSNSDHRIKNLSWILKQDELKRDWEKKKIFENENKDELKDNKGLGKKRIENPRVLIKNNINSLKREINSLKYERKILLDSLDDILVGKREEKIDQYEFDRLYLKYKIELEKKDERIKELESALEFDEIIDQRNDLTSTLENKIAEINSRIEELKNKYGFFDETAETQEEENDDNNRYEKNIKFNENSSSIQNKDNKHLSNSDEEKIIEIEKKIEDTLKRLDKYNQNESNDKDNINQYNYIESNDKDNEDKKIRDYKSSDGISVNQDIDKHSNIIPDSSNINNFSASPLSNIYSSEFIRDNLVKKIDSSRNSVIDYNSDNDNNNKKQSNNEIENLQDIQQQQQTNSVNSYNNNSSPLGNLFYHKSKK